jgi:cyclohexanecarboxylate-CoA ligase
MAATPFLADMAQSPELEGFNFSSFRTFVSAGAPIPRVIARQAADRLGAHIASGWGMTENSLVTTTRREDPEEKVFETDGLAHKGMEVRIRDAEGGLAGVGVEGWLQSRGAAQCVGYLKKPDLADVDAEGWFETGDLATMDGDGYIRITGRTKDVIIRGGENIPVVEVEELLYQHPDVSAAAIVGMPDERLGERACCFLILSAGATLTFDEMVGYLLSKGLTKTYLPERLEVVSEMPRTASGKIQKFHLRETLQR